MGPDPFQVLGLRPDASLAEARAAYRRLAALFHPDRLRGLREDVQAEGARRMREATEAVQAIQERNNRPLSAPGRQRTTQGRPTAPTQTTRAAPAPVEHEPRTVGTPPSDATTEATASIYHVHFRCLDGPGFRANWGGRHAAATLATLRRAHTIDGPIRQFEWGSYEWVLDGGATRRLLWHVLRGEEWRRDPAEVVGLSQDLRDRCLPARRGEPGAEVELGSLLDVLDEHRLYSVTAEVY